MPSLSRQSSYQSSSYGHTRSKIPVPTRRDSAPGNPPFFNPVPLAPEYSRHAALRGDFQFTPEEWYNVNQRIIETVNIVLPYGYLIQGPGPRTYELHAHLGVALVGDIVIRPIQRPCSLKNPDLQRKIRQMAADPQHPEFRHTYLNGKVWFFFRILNPDIARQPLTEDSTYDQ
ncbi:hypothetical protein GGR58DRAFT_517515 [Xylaria digitata]|nr:hypothetical protein GGR58DRAFT_517515 [Xylaria digitata]